MIARKSLLVWVMLVLTVVAGAQRRRGHDPLTDAETDELREVAQEPDKKLKLFIKYAGARMQAIEQLRGDPKLASGRGQQVHDLLEDFTALLDELDDNVNAYATRKLDISKALAEVITADSNWQIKLRTLKESPQNDPKAAAEARAYSFVLDTAIDAVNASIANARELQDEIAKQKQEEKEAQKKKGKHKE